MFDDLMVCSRKVCIIKNQLKINLTFCGNLMALSYFVKTDFMTNCFNCFLKTFPLIHYTR